MTVMNIPWPRKLGTRPPFPSCRLQSQQKRQPWLPSDAECGRHGQTEQSHGPFFQPVGENRLDMGAGMEPKNLPQAEFEYQKSFEQTVTISRLIQQTNERI